MAQCSICYHPKRVAIENDISDGGPANTAKELQKRYKITPSSILKHKQDHMVSITEEALKILDKKSHESGVNRVLNSVEVLDLIIAKAPTLIDNITIQDVLRALKLKHEILGDIKEEKKVKLEWLNEVK